MAGIDMARGLALIGMLAVHFGPKDDDSLLEVVYGLPHGRASILFAVVAGLGITLLTQRDRWRGQVRLASFALVLLPVGLALQVLDHGVAVILHHYAGFFIVGAIAVGLSTSSLLGVAIVTSVLGPAVYFAGRAEWPSLFGRSTVDLLDNPLEIGEALLFSGPYPLLTWIAPILWGMWLGRQNIARRSVALRLFLIGTAAAVASLLASHWLVEIFGATRRIDDWRLLLSSYAHSQMPLWIIQSAAIATGLVGLCLWLSGFAERLWFPLAALGRMVLSLYVLHLVILHAFPGFLNHRAVEPAIASVLGYVAFGMLVAMVWVPRGRGPVESLLHATSGLIERSVAQRQKARRDEKEASAR
ncbi:MAG TPA: hypothetical protein VGN79_10955 [Devosia sp.]|nr:hypothetical protein [Devosia sp.]